MTLAAAIREILSAEELAQIERLEFTAGRRAEGRYAGRHESKMRGGCSEFAEHRPYSAGDELRRLDWRVAAKSDRLCIKQFHEQISLSAIMVLDASGSMAYAGQPAEPIRTGFFGKRKEKTEPQRIKHRSKFEYARAALTALSRLVLGQRDAAGLAISGGRIDGVPPLPGAFPFVPPRNAPGHLAAMLRHVVRTECGGETSLVPTLERLLSVLKRRGQIVIFSDGFTQPEPLEKVLLALSARGHQLLFFHVLAREEVTFPFADSTRFESLEKQGQFIDADPGVMADDYLAALDLFIRRLRHTCGRAGGAYEPLVTDQPLGRTLAAYLHRRAAAR